jgi:hypothetical protein
MTDDAYALRDMTLIADAPFGGVPQASRGRRSLALAIDVAAVIGSPLLLIPPCYGILVVTALWGIPLWLLACLAVALMRWAGRQRNGDRLSAGQLVSGLTILRTPDACRVVIAKDVAEDLRPTRSQVVTGAVGIALAVVAAVGIWGTAGFVYYAVSLPPVDGIAEQEAAWREREPEARALVDTFLADLLSPDPRGGEAYVAVAATRSLPPYRSRIRRDGVTAFQSEGTGQNGCVWEYMFREQSPGQAGMSVQRSVTIIVEEVGGRLRVSGIVPGESYDAPTTGIGTFAP